jgi:hypothetical protein
MLLGWGLNCPILPDLTSKTVCACILCNFSERVARRRRGRWVIFRPVSISKKIK